MIFPDEMNKKSFDWCFNCAKLYCKNSHVKMFAYIVISIARMIPQDLWYFDNYFDKTLELAGFKFCLKLNYFTENEAILSELFKKRNWKTWLPALVRNHILTYCKSLTEDSVKILEKPKVIMHSDSVEVRYLYGY